MKVLCIVDKYYPESSANTTCADNLMNYFKKEGNEVDFLAIRQNLTDDVYSKIKGSNVIKFSTWYNYIIEHWYSKREVKLWEDLPFLYRKLLGLWSRIKILFRLECAGAEFDLVNFNVIYDQIKQINSTYDVIISFSMPFFNHLLAKELVKRGLAKKWFPVLLDPFVYNYVLNKNKINKRKKTAEKVLKTAEKIFMIDSFVDENTSKCYCPKYNNKVINITAPMLENLSIDKINNNDGKINMIYAGHFYDEIRNPSEMLSVLSKLPEGFVINLVGDGCESIIESKRKQFTKSELKTFGLLQKNDCLDKLYKSNILINLGNSIPNQTPSKVFEYIGMAKPIVNFYTNENDPGMKYINKYKMGFNFNLLNYTEDTIKELINFCKINKDMKLTYEEAIENLSEITSENICKKIYKEVCEISNDAK